MSAPRVFRWWMLLENKAVEHNFDEEEEAEQLTSEGARGTRDINRQNEEGIAPRAPRSSSEEEEGRKEEKKDEEKIERKEKTGEEEKEKKEERKGKEKEEGGRREEDEKREEGKGKGKEERGNGEGGGGEEGYSGEGEGIEETECTPRSVLPGEMNIKQAFVVRRAGTSLGELRDRFYRFIEKVAEIPLNVEEPGHEKYSVKKLLLRRFTKAPLQSCKVSRTRESVVVILDNSGSMSWWMENVLQIASVALSRRDIEVYIAPNGIIIATVTRSGLRELEKPPKFVNRVIVYVGDFDGANTPVELSWNNTVFWFCPESRYRHFASHDWVSYSEKDFKGMFFRVWDLNEFLDALRRALPFRRMFIDYHESDEFTDDEE